MKLLVCIPTLTGREEYLANCLRGYRERTEAELCLSVVTDAGSCGMGWNEAITEGLWEHGDDVDYVHFSNEDIVVGEGWLGPLVEAAGPQHNCIPAPRIEPAGVHLGDPMPTPIPMPPPGDPTSKGGYFYSDLPENQPWQDWQRIDHGALPFCALEQWWRIGPFIPTHFGTDKWFYHRARQEGYTVVARQRSIIYNYAAPIGRSKGEWMETDLLDFDLTVAYPAYLAGALAPTEQHPLRLTPTGLAQVRSWRASSFPGPHHWEAA